jgi:hypothetical protein
MTRIGVIFCQDQDCDGMHLVHIPRTFLVAWEVGRCKSGNTTYEWKATYCGLLRLKISSIGMELIG